MTHVGRTQSPCYGCTERNAECHSSCEQYLEFVDIHDRERAEIHQKKHKESLGYGAGYRSEREWRNSFQNKNENRVFKQRMK